MPAKGKHRRTKTQRLTRTLAVAGTGGAALALPLLGAAGAHAAPAQSASAQSAAVKDAQTYTVRAGDSLAKIADAENVSGGWKKLYEDNRDAVGDDPSLIRPGLKLAIGGKAAASADTAADTTDAADAAEKKTAQPASDTSDTSDSSAGFVAPVDGGTVGTPYHQSGSMWSSGYHTGTDFVVPTGTSLKAVGAGTVVTAGWGGAYGNQVVIKLADGTYAQYAHLSSLSVSSGDSVTAGQQIGLSGATGNVTGPHLHFEIRTTPDYGSDIDPLAYLRSKGVSV
ncbi:peptidoglycan DD-metalloendopeptidase family protein [Streptomyces sp. ISL-12]|uniref:LysM peptidoglycan-binding domain-containing M23 family metallopeptidase n=1 Tax=Streptomyces sp. ISL-12 TaxID=2819177 RepID=UPI001BEAE6EB|nr:LysM peptidoglycan-binding domain-containing M23 family metallopeptidase [Streptomyces sp. ISL-12]MBT2414406.1 peptidoglycan DD-metalloendopeptidase family protein [Streptomyces sp. ISL-12]